MEEQSADNFIRAGRADDLGMGPPTTWNHRFQTLFPSPSRPHCLPAPRERDASSSEASGATRTRFCRLVTSRPGHWGACLLGLFAIIECSISRSQSPLRNESRTTAPGGKRRTDDHQLLTSRSCPANRAATGSTPSALRARVSSGRATRRAWGSGRPVSFCKEQCE